MVVGGAAGRAAGSRAAERGEERGRPRPAPRPSAPCRARRRRRRRLCCPRLAAVRGRGSARPGRRGLRAGPGRARRGCRSGTRESSRPSGPRGWRPGPEVPSGAGTRWPCAGCGGRAAGGGPAEEEAFALPRSRTGPPPAWAPRVGNFRYTPWRWPPSGRAGEQAGPGPKLGRVVCTQLSVQSERDLGFPSPLFCNWRPVRRRWDSGFRWGDNVGFLKVSPRQHAAAVPEDCAGYQLEL